MGSAIPSTVFLINKILRGDSYSQGKIALLKQQKLILESQPMKKQILSLLMLLIFLSACSTPAISTLTHSTTDEIPDALATESGLPINTPAVDSGKTATCHKIAFAMVNFKTKVLPDIYPYARMAVI
jgi:hypothetical protein